MSWYIAVFWVGLHVSPLGGQQAAPACYRHTAQLLLLKMVSRTRQGVSPSIDGIPPTRSTLPVTAVGAVVARGPTPRTPTNGCPDDAASVRLRGSSLAGRPSFEFRALPRPLSVATVDVDALSRYRRRGRPRCCRRIINDLVAFCIRAPTSSGNRINMAASLRARCHNPSDAFRSRT